MMKPPRNFIDFLKNFDKDNIKLEQMAALKTPDLLLNPNFTYDIMMKKSFAAANLANWVINIIRYHDIINIARNDPEEQVNKQPISDDSMVDNEIFLIHNKVKWSEKRVKSTDDYSRDHFIA